MRRLGGLILALVACGETSALCENGVLVEGADASYCVVLYPIVIEGGFSCPPELPVRVEGPMGVVCTDSAMADPSALPDDVCADIGYTASTCDPGVVREPGCESPGMLTFDSRGDFDYAFCDGFPAEESSGYGLDGAQLECLGWGGDVLFDVTESGEWTFVTDHMTTHFLAGASDAETEGTWLWVATGVEAVFQPWEASHPLGGRLSNIAVAHADFGWLWADRNVSATEGYVCKRAR